MYTDFGTQITASVPTVATFIGLSTTINLKAGADGSAFAPGDGERIYMQFETVTPLVDAAGTEAAVLNFGIVLSDASDLVSANTQVLVQTGGPVNLLTVTSVGWTAADFATAGYNAAGNHFELEIPGYFWSRVFEHQALPYLGFVLTVPNYRTGSPADVGFTAGTFRARIVKDVDRAPLTRHVRSRMPI